MPMILISPHASPIWPSRAFEVPTIAGISTVSMINGTIKIVRALSLPLRFTDSHATRVPIITNPTEPSITKATIGIRFML